MNKEHRNISKRKSAELQWSVKSIIVHGPLCMLSRNTESDMLCAEYYTAPDVWHSTITNTGKYYLNLIVHACLTEQSLKAAFFAVKQQHKLLNILSLKYSTA